jgi:hypothetical protein
MYDWEVNTNRQSKILNHQSKKTAGLPPCKWRHFMKKVLALTILGLFLVAGNAMATSVDFTDQATWETVIDGNQSFTGTVDGVDFTATANSYEDVTFTWNQGDGIGIDGDYEYDEIEGGEWITITFAESIQLDQVFLTDFFTESRGGHDPYQEEGWYNITYDGNETREEFSAYNTSTPNGDYIIELGGAWVDSISLAGAGEWGWEDHEFSLAGFSTVPEPGTVLLLGAGLVGLIGLGRKRIKN